MAKRSLEFSGNDERLTPKKVKSSNPNTTIDGVITSISPTKKEKSNFFDGELTDGQAVVRMVGFSQQQHDALENFLQKNLPVTLTNVQIQKNKITQKLEILLKKHTQVNQSPAKFEINDVATVGSKAITLAELEHKTEYDRVTLRAKVSSRQPSEKVGQGKTKQEVYLADKTGTANLTLWEEDINKLKIGESYQLNRVVVRFYRGKKHLSFPSRGASWTKIDDIGEVMDEDIALDSEDTLIQSAQIIGAHLTEVRSCFYCKRGNVKQQEGNKFGTCEMCKLDQVLTSCSLKQSAKLFLESTDIQTHVTVRAYGKLLEEIAQTEKITSHALMNAPPFDGRYNEYHVLTSVSRN